MGYSELQSIISTRSKLNDEQREVEADAYAVLRTRSTFFGLKLLLGLDHQTPQPETGIPEATEATTAT